MAMEEALVARLNTALTTLGARASWYERPRRGALPCVVLTKAGGTDVWTHSGRDDLAQARVQFDVHSLDSMEAIAVAEAVLIEMSAAAEVEGWSFDPAMRTVQVSNVGDLDGGERMFLETQIFMFYHSPAEA